MQAVGGGLISLAAQFSDKSTLKVCIHVMRYTNRRLYFFLPVAFQHSHCSYNVQLSRWPFAMRASIVQYRYREITLANGHQVV